MRNLTAVKNMVWDLIVVEIEHVARPVSNEIMQGMPALKMAVLNL